jgi:hypothetical protein
MNPNNPLQKSLEETYFEGGKDYQYGGYIPPVIFGSPVSPSPTPTSSITPTPTNSPGVSPTPTPTPTISPTKTATPTPTPSVQFDYYFAENCCSPFDTQTFKVPQGTIINQDGGFITDGGSGAYVVIGNATAPETKIYDSIVDDVCNSLICASPTPTPTSTTTPTPTTSPGSSPTPTPSITPTISVSPTQTPSNTPTTTPTISVSPSQTPTITPTKTTTQTPTGTPTMTPTGTKTPTPTPTITNTPSITPTQTRTPTPTPSCTGCSRKYSVFNESYTLTGVIRYTATNCQQITNYQIPPRATRTINAKVYCACVGGNYPPTSAQTFIKVSLIGCLA